jgi:GNAT superfamily N-acetyltransferase
LKRTAPITLRQATPSDAPAIHTMILELADSLDANGRVTSTAGDIRGALSGDEPAVHAIIAENEGRPVGVAVFFLTFSTWRGARGVYLQDLFVRADAQATGLGRRLVDSVVAWARERGASHLRLSVDRRNSAARAFYEAVGMTHSDEECIYALAGPSFARRDPRK